MQIYYLGNRQTQYGSRGIGGRQATYLPNFKGESWISN